MTRTALTYGSSLAAGALLLRDEKLEVSRRTQAVRKARDLRLIA